MGKKITPQQVKASAKLVKHGAKQFLTDKQDTQEANKEKKLLSLDFGGVEETVIAKAMKTPAKGLKMIDYIGILKPGVTSYGDVPGLNVSVHGQGPAHGISAFPEMLDLEAFYKGGFQQVPKALYLPKEWASALQISTYSANLVSIAVYGIDRVRIERHVVLEHGSQQTPVQVRFYSTGPAGWHDRKMFIPASIMSRLVNVAMGKGDQCTAKEDDVDFGAIANHPAGIMALDVPKDIQGFYQFDGAKWIADHVHASPTPAVVATMGFHHLDVHGNVIAMTHDSVEVLFYGVSLAEKDELPWKQWVYEAVPKDAFYLRIMGVYQSLGLKLPPAVKLHQLYTGYTFPQKRVWVEQQALWIRQRAMVIAEAVYIKADLEPRDRKRVDDIIANFEGYFTCNALDRDWVREKGKELAHADGVPDFTK